MIKTLKQPTILIITPIHPVDFIEAFQTLNASFNQFNEVFSVQAMALLGESIQWHTEDGTEAEPPYFCLNHLFCSNPSCASVRSNINKPYIVIGNIPKNAEFKPQTILCLEGSSTTEKDFDPYLTQAQALLTESEFDPIEYYTPADAEYTFTNIKHLQLLLTKLGFRQNQTK